MQQIKAHSLSQQMSKNKLDEVVKENEAQQKKFAQEKEALSQEKIKVQKALNDQLVQNKETQSQLNKV